MILTILAKQMRLLDRRIPVELGDAAMLTAIGSQLSITEIKIKGKKKKKHKKKEISSTSSSSGQTVIADESGKKTAESERRRSIKHEKLVTLEKIASLQKLAEPSKDGKGKTAALEKIATDKSAVRSKDQGKKTDTEKSVVRRKDEDEKLVPLEKLQSSEKVLVHDKEPGMKKDEDKSLVVGSSSETTESFTSSESTEKVSCIFMFCL